MEWWLWKLLQVRAILNLCGFCFNIWVGDAGYVIISNATYKFDFTTGYRRDDAKCWCENLEKPMSLLHFENDRFNQKWKIIRKWLKENGKLFWCSWSKKNYWSILREKIVLGQIIFKMIINMKFNTPISGHYSAYRFLNIHFLAIINTLCNPCNPII